MNDGFLIDSWSLFKEYVDKKHLEIVAEKFVDICGEYGFSDNEMIEAIGGCNYLDSAIRYYLELDDEEDEE